MKTKIIKIRGDWQEILDDCRATVGKEPLGKEPSKKFKREILISEHSPIRDIEIKFRWSDIPYWVAMHWKTHKWESRTNTQRNDRQKLYDRGKAPQDSPVTFIGEPNVQHLIDTMRKRLCMKASPETRKLAEDFKTTLKTVEPEIADVLVPNCVYRCGCPEPNGCSWYEAICVLEPKMASTNIQERYDAYNNMFHAGGDDHVQN
jgi:hypothetical protein